MRNFMTTLAAAIAATCLFAPQSASAAHDTPLFRAACNYRDVTREFQRAVNRSPYLDHYVERVVDRLGDAASRLAGRARHLNHPDHIEHLLLEWNQVKYLQPRVEQIVFANPACPSRVELLPCWERVTCAYRELAALIAPICATPVARPVVTYRPPVCVEPPRVTVPNYHVPRTTVPSFRVPTQPVPSYRVPTRPVPNYKNPHQFIPNRTVPRPAPEVIPAVPESHPTHFRSRGRWTPTQPAPYWNASRSRSIHSSAGRGYSNRDDFMYSYKGIDTGSLAALIARLVD